MSIERKKPKIGQVMMKLGNTPSVKGFHYLKAGIRFCIKDPKSVTNLAQLIYPRVADEFDTSVKAVERASRSSIQSSWHLRDRELTREIFGNTLQSEAEIPSNALYISALAEWFADDEE